MKKYQVLKPLIFVLACVIAARFFLPANWTPVLALALFMPYVTQNRSIQVLMPIGVLLITDIFLGFYGQTMYFVYASLILIALISNYQSKGSLLSLMKYSVSSVMIWHIVVNFGVYLNGQMEEHTSELQSHSDLVCRLLLEKKKKNSLKVNF